MARLGYFIRRRGDECSIVKVLPNGGEEILEHGLTPAHAETLYFICIGEPVRHEKSSQRMPGPTMVGCRPAISTARVRVLRHFPAPLILGGDFICGWVHFELATYAPQKMDPPRLKRRRFPWLELIWADGDCRPSRRGSVSRYGQRALRAATGARYAVVQTQAIDCS